MPTAIRKESKAPLRVSGPDLLRRFLQAYWLRPENAFWMTLRSETLAECPIEGPALDIACGDGLFSFLHCGGALHPSFDVFHAVALDVAEERSPHDMFDCCDDDYRPTVIEVPSAKFSIGLDLKPALLAKAARLDFYDVLVRHDCNQPLPFDDHAFKTIYCNAAYWIDNIAGFMDELRRITRSDGRVVLQVKLDTMARHTLAAHHKQLGSRVLEIIGRDRLDCWQSLADRRTWEDLQNAAYWIDNIAGFMDELRRITRSDGRVVLQVKLDTMARHTLAAHHKQLGSRVLEIIGRDRLDCWQSLADRRTWEDRFARAGLLVERETPFITGTHAHIWDIGLRPIAPMLTKLANGVSAQTRVAVKAEWVDLFMDLATPLCDAHLNLLDGESEPVEIQYQLRPL